MQYLHHKYKNAIFTKIFIKIHKQQSTVLLASLDC